MFRKGELPNTDRVRSAFKNLNACIVMHAHVSGRFKQSRAQVQRRWRRRLILVVGNLFSNSGAQYRNPKIIAPETKNVHPSFPGVTRAAARHDAMVSERSGKKIKTKRNKTSTPARRYYNTQRSSTASISPTSNRYDNNTIAGGCARTADIITVHCLPQVLTMPMNNDCTNATHGKRIFTFGYLPEHYDDLRFD
jgi:hypothetical protein